MIRVAFLVEVDLVIFVFTMNFAWARAEAVGLIIRPIETKTTQAGETGRYSIDIFDLVVVVTVFLHSSITDQYHGGIVAMMNDSSEAGKWSYQQEIRE